MLSRDRLSIICQCNECRSDAMAHMPMPFEMVLMKSEITMKENREKKNEMKKQNCSDLANGTTTSNTTKHNQTQCAQTIESGTYEFAFTPNKRKKDISAISFLATMFCQSIRKTCYSRDDSSRKAAARWVKLGQPCARIRKRNERKLAPHTNCTNFMNKRKRRNRPLQWPKPNDKCLKLYIYSSFAFILRRSSTFCIHTQTHTDTTANNRTDIEMRWANRSPTATRLIGCWRMSNESRRAY